MGFMKPNIPKPAPPPPPPAEPKDSTNAPDPEALQRSRERASEAQKRADRNRLRRPLGSVTGDSGLSLL